MLCVLYLTDGSAAPSNVSLLIDHDTPYLRSLSLCSSLSSLIFFLCKNSNSLCKSTALTSPPSLSQGPPSAPRNVISSINETSVILDWSWPEDTGGRKDVTFTVVCKRCRGVADNGSNSGTQHCEPCRSSVRFLPRATGLQNTTVTVGDLLAHTNYTFEIEAQNGVSSLAPKMRQYAAVTITTNQAGEISHQAALTQTHEQLKCKIDLPICSLPVSFTTNAPEHK